MSETNNDPDLEVNSGVEFPGNESLEPYIGSSQTLADDVLNYAVVVVEVRENEQQKFAFNYKKN